MSTGTKPKETLAFSVENFGPIARAKFDLRPLTVFVGPDNTGKSYLAMLVYAMHDGFCKGLHFPSFGDRRWTREIERLSPKERGTFSGWLADCPRVRPEDPDGIPSIPSIVEQAVRRVIREMRGFDTDVAESLKRCFGKKDLGGLVYDRATRPASVGVRMSGVSGRAGVDIRLGSRGITLRGHPTRALRFMPSAMIDKSPMAHFFDMGRDECPKLRESMAYGALVHSGLGGMLAPLACPAHYLPASRRGIMNARKMIVRALAERAGLDGIRPAMSTPLLLGTAIDFILRMTDSGETGGHYSKIAREIERDILQGTIHEERTSGASCPEFVYRSRRARDGGKISMVDASAAVSELAPVVLFLRGFVRRGDVLIIEEPESHLHPAMQAKLAVQLAKLAHAGLKVIVTTHSEWIVEQFANLVGVFGSGDSATSLVESEFPDLAGASLKGKDVGVWLFSPRKTSGTVVKEIKLDAEAGVFPAGFDRVAWELHNGWAAVRSTIRRECRGN